MDRSKPYRPRESESSFQTRVLHLAAMYGWRVMHVRKSRDPRTGDWTTTTSVSGWPDLFLWHPDRGGYYAAELKADDGYPTAKQQEIIDSLLRAGIPAAVWRPRNWRRIEAFLAGRIPPPFVTASLGEPT